MTRNVGTQRATGWQVTWAFFFIIYPRLGGEEASDPEMLRDTDPSKKCILYYSNDVKFSKTLIVTEQISDHLGMGWGKGRMERL